MDSITHIAIGACLGDAIAGKQFGKKAMLWGALAHSFPDIDFLASFWLDTASDLLAHRGFTHSILGVVIASALLSFVATRVHPHPSFQLGKWFQFFLILIGLHIFLDAFNNYGVGWFEPFSHRRISFNILYVADPFFSLVPIVAAVVIAFLPTNSSKRSNWIKLSMITASMYLVFAIWNKYRINSKVMAAFEKEHIPHDHYFTTPAPLQNWLWYTVAGDEKGFYVAFTSLLDSSDRINWNYYPKQDSLLTPFRNTEDLQHLIRFSQGFYTVEKRKDTVLFNDLRFGQVFGWQQPKAPFVFYFYLTHPSENNMIVQRGRFKGWTWENFVFFVDRVRGH
ncbi:MAG: metal-dependent hydrolase [Chitinophagaceae bacterium]|uniref:metal-dependent hydrolase n=1 Tax=unclassified Paraflavitalea TaxID=2798305 RepID=UPI003D326F0E|nr:metal-dependent hydrolase [Chitinophagaceae bacterium]